MYHVMMCTVFLTLPKFGKDQSDQMQCKSMQVIECIPNIVNVRYVGACLDFATKKNLMVTQHNVTRVHVHVLAQRSSDEKLIQNVHVHVALELEEVGHDTHVIIT